MSSQIQSPSMPVSIKYRNHVRIRINYSVNITLYAGSSCSVAMPDGGVEMFNITLYAGPSCSVATPDGGVEQMAAFNISIDAGDGNSSGCVAVSDGSGKSCLFIVTEIKLSCCKEIEPDKITGSSVGDV